MAFVELEVKGQVGILTINRPEALNALNDQVIAQLGETLDSLDLNALRCLIVTGSGAKAFVAGADIGQMSGLSKATNWFRMGWTTYSPTFFVNNVIRDYFSTYQNFTEKNSPGLLQWTKYWALGMKEAFGDEFGWTSAVIDEMERQNMFQTAPSG